MGNLSLSVPASQINKNKMQILWKEFTKWPFIEMVFPTVLPKNNAFILL